MRVYYAHCMDIYHTEQEKEDIKKLKSLGFDVVNPSDEQFNEQWEVAQMEFADALIKGCGGLAFRRALNGRIPSGVSYEINKATEFGLPVFELPAIRYGDGMTHEETRQYLTENPSEYYKKRMAGREKVSRA